MNVVQWYYAKNNEQFGPILSAELRRLAETGQLGPEDLVWRPGMEDWAAASLVKGLFDGSPSVAVKDSATATKDSQPSVKEASGAVGETPAAARDVQATARESQGAARDSRTVKDSQAVRDSRAAVKDSRPTNSAAAVFKVEPVATDVENSVTPNSLDASPAARPAPLPRPAEHILDHLLGAIKGNLTGRFVDATAMIFRACGYYGLYAAMVVLGLFAVVAGLSGVARDSVILALVIIPLLILFQYVAYRFLGALQRLNRATPGRLGSSAVLDCFALLSLFAGTAALIGLAILAVQTQTVGMVLSAVAAFIICQYLAVIAMNPAVVYFTVGDTGSAGEEALSLISCLLKVILLRMAPVLFGVGVVCGVVGLGYATLVLLLAGQGSTSLAILTARTAIAVLCMSAVLPLAAYLSFLSLHLGIDVLRGLVRLADPQDRRRYDGTAGPK